jgi:hypothetical protein
MNPFYGHPMIATAFSAVFLVSGWALFRSYSQNPDMPPEIRREVFKMYLAVAAVITLASVVTSMLGQILASLP